MWISSDVAVPHVIKATPGSDGKPRRVVRSIREKRTVELIDRERGERSASGRRVLRIGVTKQERVRRLFGSLNATAPRKSRVLDTKVDVEPAPAAAPTPSRCSAFGDDLRLDAVAMEQHVEVRALRRALHGTTIRSPRRSPMQTELPVQQVDALLARRRHSGRCTRGGTIESGTGATHVNPTSQAPLPHQGGERPVGRLGWGSTCTTSLQVHQAELADEVRQRHRETEYPRRPRDR